MKTELWLEETFDNGVVLNFTKMIEVPFFLRRGDSISLDDGDGGMSFVSSVEYSAFDISKQIAEVHVCNGGPREAFADLRKVMLTYATSGWSMNDYMDNHFGGVEVESVEAEIISLWKEIDAKVGGDIIRREIEKLPGVNRNV